MVDEHSLITDELRATVSVTSPERTVTLTDDLVQRVRETLTGGPGADDRRAPPAVLFALTAEQELSRRDGLPESSLVTGDEWEWRRGLRLGETLTSVTRVTDVYERFGGRLGHALFLRYEWAFTGADGGPAAFARRTIAYYAGAGARPAEEEPPPEMLPPADPAPGVDPRHAGEGDPLIAQMMTPTLTQVVRYCGAAWSFVPQFYDPEAARAAGLPGTLVPGPLKLALLSEMVLAWAGPDAFLETIRAAHRRPDMPGRPVLLRGAVTRADAVGTDRRIECEVWIENVLGARTTVGAAVVRVPRV